MSSSRAKGLKYCWYLTDKHVIATKCRLWEFARHNDTVLCWLHPHGGIHLTALWGILLSPWRSTAILIWALLSLWRVAAWDLHDCIQSLRCMQTLETFGKSWKTQENYRKVKRSLQWHRALIIWLQFYLLQLQSFLPHYTLDIYHRICQLPFCIPSKLSLLQVNALKFSA